MVKAKEFQYGGQDRSFNEKSEFFTSNTCSNNSISFFFFVKIAQKKRAPLE